MYTHNLHYNMTSGILHSYIMETWWIQQLCTPQSSVGLKGMVHK